MSIKYTGSDGRSYPDAASMIQARFDELLNETYASVERAITGTVCKVHGKNPSVRRQQRGDTIQFEIKACCEESQDDAQEAARQAMTSAGH